MLVVCVPISAEGHLNTSLGLALALKNHGHDVVYVIEKTYAGRFLKHGFKEEIYFEFGLDEDGSKTVNWEEYIKNLFPLIRLPPTEQSQFYQGIFKRQLKNLEKSDDQILAIINTVKPDIILLDSCLLSASVVFCGIPFVAHCPLNPLAVIHNEKLPPPWSAFSLLDKDESKWTEQRERWLKEFVSNTEYSNWLVSKGAPPLTGCCHNSPHLNLITYPKALLTHYLKYYEMGPNWFSVDHCIRPNSDSFEVPEKLRTLPGKLIMLSMGSLGSADVELMKKLVDILSKTNHRYIVNGGCYHGQYQLANNMWGAPFLPQLAVLKVADLFITHGGNNSFIESLYYGVPMVVIPLFVDQFDNAAMAEDGKVGLKFMPFLEPKENLVDKLETVLNSDEIRQNVKAISESLQESKSLDEAVKRMEAVVDERN